MSKEDRIRQIMEETGFDRERALEVYGIEQGGPGDVIVVDDDEQRSIRLTPSNQTPQ